MRLESAKKTFSRFGIPKEVNSDPGSQFTRNLYKSFSEELNIKFGITSPKHNKAIANGLTERYIGTVKKIFYKIVQEKIYVNLALLQYRNTSINKTGATPAELLFGRSRNLIPFCNNTTVELNKCKESLLNNQLKQKEYFNKGARALNY